MELETLIVIFPAFPCPKVLLIKLDPPRSSKVSAETFTLPASPFPELLLAKEDLPKSCSVLAETFTLPAVPTACGVT